MAKGQKTGGRQKGTPNQVSRTVREILSQVIAEEMEALPELLENLDPKQRIEVVIKLLPYVTPKVDQSILQQESHTDSQNRFYENIIEQMKKKNIKPKDPNKTYDYTCGDK